MENIITYWILPNWKRKLMALFGGIILWVYVNQSVMATKTLTGVPVRVEHLADDKTIEGLLPNHFLRRRLTLTLSGNKQILELIEAGDLEVRLNATDAPTHWLVEITPNNLVSLNPSVKIDGAINGVSHQEMVLEIASLATARVPIRITAANGAPPRGYEFLGIWPNLLFHTVSGPAEQIEALKKEGLELNFNLDDISSLDLDKVTPTQKGFFQDEISYPIPFSWKMVRIPFRGIWEMINDPEAGKLHIEFLKKEYLPITHKLPIRLYYPIKYLEIINPETRPLAASPLVEFEHGLAYLNSPLYAYDVSRLFLDIVKDHIEIVLTAKPIEKEYSLRWSLEFIEPQILEDRYINYLETRYDVTRNKQYGSSRETERRNRFRNYMQKMSLYTAPRVPLKLDNHIEGNKLLITKSQSHDEDESP